MDCERNRDASETAEQYVTGQLEEQEREEFETHYFACRECLRHVQVMQEVRSLPERKS